MKRHLYLLFLWISFPGMGQNIASTRFSAYVRQNGAQVPILEHVVQLQKAPFEIVVNLPLDYGVFVHVSYKKHTYHQVLTNVEIKDMPPFHPPALFEAWNNPFRELIVSDNQPQFWFVKNSDAYRFSKYQILNGRLVGVRYVNRVYDLDKQTPHELSQMNHPIYVSFIMRKKQGDDPRGDELMRHEFIIEWVN